MKKVFFLFFMLVMGSALAREIPVILPNPVGSPTDLLFRIVQKEYKELTGDTLVPHYHPGGDHVIGAMAFKNSGNDAVLLGTTSIHVFNPVQKSDLPYSDADFRHVTWVARVPGIYVASPNSPYHNMRDLVSGLPHGQKPFFGLIGPSTAVNITLMKKHRVLDEKVEIVYYKGATQAELAVASNEVDAVIYGTTSATAALHKAGRIRILGQTLPHAIDLDGIKVPSVVQELNVPQLNGGNLISVKPGADVVWVEKFSRDMQTILSRPLVQQQISKLNAYPFTVSGQDAVTRSIMEMRDQVRDSLKP